MTGNGEMVKEATSIRVVGMTVGKLAALISCCIVGTISCSSDELIAIDQVSNVIHMCMY